MFDTHKAKMILWWRNYC